MDCHRVHCSPYGAVLAVLPRTFRYRDDPTQSHQGRVVSVRAKLLPALSACRAATAVCRYRGLSHWVPLCAQRVAATFTNVRDAGSISSLPGLTRPTAVAGGVPP